MDSSVWVVSQALDSVFDVFGDDNCSPSIFVSIELMPVLERTQSTFKARVSVDKMYPRKICIETETSLIPSS